MPPIPATSHETQPRAALSQGQRLQVLSTFDAIEVELGHAAITKAHAPAVRALADVTVEHHGKARERRAQFATLSGSGLVESSLSRQLAAHGRATLEDLLSSDTGPFDRLYVKTQLEQQRTLLQLLDEQFIPRALGKERETLQEARGLAQHQLSLAQQVNASLPR